MSFSFFIPFPPLVGFVTCTTSDQVACMQIHWPAAPGPHGGAPSGGAAQTGRRHQGDANWQHSVIPDQASQAGIEWLHVVQPPQHV